MRKKLFSILALLLTVSGAWAGNITVYFTDALSWGDIKIYYTSPSSSKVWPGDAMTEYETNSYGQKVYSASIPDDATLIVFNGNGKQTVNITKIIEDGALWYSIDQIEGSNYMVKSPNVTYYVVGTMNNWEISKDYRLTLNTTNSAEYYIHNLSLTDGDKLKVVSSEDNGNSKATHYPDGADNDYTIPATTTYSIYFQPNGSDGRAGWYYGKIYPVVTLNDTDNGTLLNDLNGKTVNITTNRTLKAGGWNTLCLPFSADYYSEILGTLRDNGLTVKKLSNATLNGDDLTLYFEGALSITAGEPYLVKVNNDIENISFANVIISNALTPTTINNVVSFIPVMSPTELTANDKTVLFIKGGNKLTYPSTTSNINGFRAYFKQPTNSNARVFNMSFDDDATGISFVLSDEAKTDNGIYMMDGRRVQGQPKQKGVYIVNGKKTIIK